MQLIESLETIVELSPFNTNCIFRRKHHKIYFSTLSKVLVLFLAKCLYGNNISINRAVFER